MMKRVFFDTILLLSVFLLPWWATLALAIFGLFIFSNFYEFLASSVIVFVLSSKESESFFDQSFIIYLSIIVFYLSVQYLRNYIILYKK